MRLKRAIALTSVSAIFGSSPRARRLAACNSGCGSDVAGILLGLQKFATFSKDLASVGLLGQQLPLVPLAPAGDNALKFADAYQSTVSPRVDPCVPASVGLTLTSHLVWTYDKGNNAF